MMIKTIKYAAVIGLLGVQLAGCGGAVLTEPAVKVEPGAIIAGEMCDYIKNRHYYTAELGENGDTLDGVRLGHWSAHFADGLVRFNHSDVGSSGSYTCEHGEVVISLDGAAPVVLEFDHGENPNNSHLQPYNAFRFSPLGLENKLYLAAKAEQAANFALCESVAGRSYRAAPPGDPAVIAIETPFIDFGKAQVVEYEITGSGQAPFSGIFECDLGEIHLHSSASDTDPVVVRLHSDSADRIIAEQGDYSIEMVAAGSECVADGEVCVAEPQSVQCFTTPCPDGFHKTVTRCATQPPVPYEIVQEGTCGDLEGQPWYAQTECTKGEPVCGAVLKMDPCTSLPCPRAVHQSFDDACAASDANAPVLFEQVCGKSEGEPVAELPIACTEKLGFPVCAKSPADIQCVTAPCPTHQYQSFADECVARTQLAAFAFSGACADLEGTLAFEQPPVRVVEQLPKVEKSVEVISAAIADDVLTVELGYSGCSEQHFHFYASSFFLESAPVQVEYAFEPLVNDACLAYFTTEFVYDLLPLKHVYQQAYQTQTGTVVLPGIGSYSF